MTECCDCEGPCRHHGPITGIPGVRVGSPSRIFTGNPVGKRLTDRKIEVYRKAGKYGPVEVQPETGPRCSCGGTKKVRKMDYSYLPKPGYYCAVCLDRYRKERDQERKLASLVRERRRSYL